MMKKKTVCSVHWGGNCGGNTILDDSRGTQSRIYLQALEEDEDDLEGNWRTDNTFRLNKLEHCC